MATLGLTMLLSPQDGSGEVVWQEYAEAKALLILDQRKGLADCLTPEEREDARGVFNNIDVSGDGSINETEERTPRHGLCHLTLVCAGGARIFPEARTERCGEWASHREGCGEICGEGSADALHV
jgi:hypothetical protein